MKTRVFFILVISLIGCDPTDDRMKIRNATNVEIFYSIAKGDSLIKNPLYIVNNDTIWGSSNIVLPNSYFNHALIGPNEWEYFINRDCEDSTLRLFLFEKELISMTPWDSIISNQLYSKKVSMTVDDLRKQNWEIIYDGS